MGKNEASGDWWSPEVFCLNAADFLWESAVDDTGNFRSREMMNSI
jgi:hypothetical protein